MIREIKDTDFGSDISSDSETLPQLSDEIREVMSEGNNNVKLKNK
jgi:hypothetical protein